MQSVCACSWRDPSRSEARKYHARRVRRSACNGLGTCDCDKRVPQVETITQTSVWVEPAYLAPEMAAGPMTNVGAASDVYLLGAILYEVLTGNPPHTGKTVMKCLMAAARNEIQATTESGELIEIALRAMATHLAPISNGQRIFRMRARVRIALGKYFACRVQKKNYNLRSTNKIANPIRALCLRFEAYALWDNNLRAKQGIVTTQLAYAKTAKSQGDLNLANSVLSANEPEHVELKSEIQLAIAERDARLQRLRTAKKLIISMAAAVIIIVSGALELLLTVQHGKVVAARDQAEQQRLAAESARDEERLAKEQEKNLVRKPKPRKSPRSNLLKKLAKRNPPNARQKIKPNKHASPPYNHKRLPSKPKWLRSTKVTSLKIGLASAKVNENAFGDVLELLNECPADLRDWEWGRLHYMCGRAEQEFRCRGGLLTL